MSAYGPSPPRSTDLPILSAQFIELKVGNNIVEDTERSHLAIFHLTAQTIPSELATYLHQTFQDELDRGMTYPQESPMTRSGFDVYFLGNDLFVGILVGSSHTADCSLERTRNGREWSTCVGGTYYVKPNYPGRSSHLGTAIRVWWQQGLYSGNNICNAGFLVPPKYRGRGIATALGQSYVVNAPLLGYKASVFNLVYVDNIASVRIWERLGFIKAGRIPFAGRLKRKGDNGISEEYVDAWVIYKSFIGDSAYNESAEKS